MRYSTAVRLLSASLQRLQLLENNCTERRQKRAIKMYSCKQANPHSGDRGVTLRALKGSSPELHQLQVSNPNQHSRASGVNVSQTLKTEMAAGHSNLSCNQRFKITVLSSSRWTMSGLKAEVPFCSVGKWQVWMDFTSLEDEKTQKEKHEKQMKQQPGHQWDSRHFENTYTNHTTSKNILASSIHQNI